MNQDMLRSHAERIISAASIEAKWRLGFEALSRFNFQSKGVFLLLAQLLSWLRVMPSSSRTRLSIGIPRV